MSSNCENHLIGVAAGFIGTSGAIWVLLQVNSGFWDVVGKVVIVLVTVVVGPTLGKFFNEYYTKKISPKIFKSKPKRRTRIKK